MLGEGIYKLALESMYISVYVHVCVCVCYILLALFFSTRSFILVSTAFPK